MRTANTSVTPNRALLGRMSPSERAMGRFMRNPDEHTPTPPVPTPEPVETQDPPVIETPPAPTGPSDAEAKLVKDVMKHKNAARDAQAALDAATQRLAAYGDATPEEIAQFRADKAAAERAAAEARGEYDRIVTQIREQADAREAELTAATQAANDRLADTLRQIDELTVGRAFGDSKFIAESTVLSPKAARKLFGEHVEMLEGEMVVYDKPKGAKNRTPLVDARGEYLSFEAGIEKVIKADDDFESIGRAKIKPGSHSTPAAVAKEDPKPIVGTGKNRMAAALNARSGK